MDKPLTTILEETLAGTSTHPSLEWKIPDGSQSQKIPRADIFAMPERLNEVPEWLRIPLRRFLCLKQRNWPAKTVYRSTRQLFSRMNHMISFFIQGYGWQEWRQMTPLWLEDYIDTRLREGKQPGTINWDLIHFRALCQFLIDEGYDMPASILKTKTLDTPRRLPRPLSAEHVHRLEKCILMAIEDAKNDYQRALASRDLACFYLLFHCGMRISEVCSLKVSDIDLEGRKIFISNSKERKDRIAYMSDTVVLAIQQHLANRLIQDPIHVISTKQGALNPRSLQRRLVHYRGICDVPVTAQRLRHTFASQMLATGMPVSSLQRYLGHEHLDTTMIYAEVSDPLLRRDYYQGIAALDPGSENISMNGLAQSQQHLLRQLVEELKSSELDQSRRDEILDMILARIR